MDAVLLTWRWQNILSIWVMIIGLFLLATVASQFLIGKGKKASGNA